MGVRCGKCLYTLLTPPPAPMLQCGNDEKKKMLKIGRLTTNISCIVSSLLLCVLFVFLYVSHFFFIYQIIVISIDNILSTTELLEVKPNYYGLLRLLLLLTMIHEECCPIASPAP